MGDLGIGYMEASYDESMGGRKALWRVFVYPNSRRCDMEPFTPRLIEIEDWPFHTQCPCPTCDIIRSSAVFSSTSIVHICSAWFPRGAMLGPANLTSRARCAEWVEAHRHSRRHPISRPDQISAAPISPRMLDAFAKNSLH